MKPLRRMVILALLISVSAFPAHAHDIRIPVIVDTDGAFDDIRAMSMLLNVGEVDIRLMVATDGVLDPEAAHQNIRRLLSSLNHEEILTAVGKPSPSEAPPFRKINQRMIWSAASEGGNTGGNSSVSPAQSIADAINSAGSRVLYICLGPMTHLAAALKANAQLKDRIYRVLSLGDTPESPHPGFNTDRDPESASAVFSSGVSVYSFGMENEHYLPFNDPLYHSCCRADSPAGRLVCTLHGDPEVRKRIENSHMRIWDEMTVIGLMMPEAFTFVPDDRYPNHKRVAAFDADKVRTTFVKLLGNPADFHLDERNSVVLSAFPADPALFREDVAPYVAEIIERHGEEEWKACLLTHELHRHLGIYSLVGAKMGIRARELLEAPFDSLTVVSKAGLKPPSSCMNDGLQVSTGASLGRGTIRVDESRPRPEALFVYGSTRLVLKLKPSYVARINSDIQAALDQFGGLGPSYFAHIRELSIRYWQKFDRLEMFEEGVQE